MCFSIAFGIANFSDADMRPCADHPRANVFPRTAVGMLRGLSIKDAGRSMPVRRAWAISRSENKVDQAKLCLLKHVWEVKSFRRQTRTQKQAKLFENTSGLRFAKRDSRNVMLNCFQMHENTSISINLISKSKRVYEQDFSAVWKPS